MAVLSIDEIIAHVNKNFLARPQYYTVTIGGANSPPNKQSLLQTLTSDATKFVGGIGGTSSPIGAGIQSLMNPNKDSAKISSGQVPDATQDVMMNACALSIPGINLGFTPEKRYGLGTTTQYPNTKSFTELNMTFYESAFENERAYFSKWVDMIYNKDSRRWGYYNDYVKTVTISQYDRTGNMVYSVKLLEAYPSAMAPLSRGYTLDVPSQFDIGFQFMDMVEVFTAQPPVTFGLNLPTLAQISQIVQSLTGPNSKTKQTATALHLPGEPQIPILSKIPTLGGIDNLFPNLL